MPRRFAIAIIFSTAALLVLGVPAAPRQAQSERLAFESNRTGNSDIWISDADGSGQRDLTRNSPVNDATPALSPDGGQIVFSRASGDRAQLWLMNADGSGQRPLGSGKGSETHPAWSPAGDRIAYVSLIAGRWDVWVVTLEGVRRQLTSDSAAQIDVSWSPQGDRIVFDRLDRGTSDLWTIPADGGTPTQVTSTPTVAELNPDWSPVRDEIAYDAVDAKGVYDLYVLDLNAKQQRRVTNDAADDGDPTWSPDGQTLAFRREVGPDYEIAKIDAAGKTKPSNVSRNPYGLDFAPSWERSTAKLGAARQRRQSINPQWLFKCDDAYKGTAASDTYYGTTGVNHMCGAGAKDYLYGCGNADYISGGGGAGDLLYGFGSSAKCNGAASSTDGNDWLKARDGNADSLYGQTGSSDHGFIDANDNLSSVEKPEYPET